MEYCVAIKKNGILIRRQRLDPQLIRKTAAIAGTQVFGFVSPGILAKC